MTGKEVVLGTMNQRPNDRPVVTLITGDEWYFNYANQPFADAKTSPEKKGIDQKIGRFHLDHV